MRANQQANQTVQFRLLSDDQLEETKRTALHLLEDAGLDVQRTT
jgi:trimethylamine:corrinoid methyltransferase-like protein